MQRPLDADDSRQTKLDCSTGQLSEWKEFEIEIGD